MTRNVTMLAAAAFAAGAVLVTTAAADPVILQPYLAGNFRWRDTAGNRYADTYRASYSYTQATVSVTFTTNGTILSGVMTADGLKPNFAYQFKLEGRPEEDPDANEKLGFAGRWWEQVWSDGAWSAGQNLNNKGDGYGQIPNDKTYLARKDVVNTNSTTKRHYYYTGYRPLDYFVTDGSGHAALRWRLDSAYHVLWRTSRRVRGADDGPIRSATVNPAASGPPAYTNDYPPATVEVYGEWERRPVGGVYLAPGDHTMGFLITEESFHGVDGPFSGVWAHAFHGTFDFTIQPPTLTASVVPAHGGYVDPSGTAAVAIGSRTGVLVRAYDYWEITNLCVNGDSVGATNAWEFPHVTNHHVVVAYLRAALATNGVPKWWLAARDADWTNDFDAAALGDQDQDGRTTWQEYLAGTDPTNSLSRFGITALRTVGPTNVLVWVSPFSDPGLPPFGVYRAAAPTGGWALVDCVARAPDGTNRWREAAAAPGGEALFYRIVATNADAW